MLHEDARTLRAYAPIGKRVANRPEVGLVVNASTDGEQLPEIGADQRVDLEAKPGCQRRVQSRDPHVGAYGQVPAWRILVQVLDIEVIDHDGLTKSAMVSAVSSGAVICGQWPLTSSVMRTLPGICSCTNRPT